MAERSAAKSRTKKETGSATVEGPSSTSAFSASTLKGPRSSTIGKKKNIEIAKRKTDTQNVMKRAIQQKVKENNQKMAEIEARLRNISNTLEKREKRSNHSPGGRWFGNANSSVPSNSTLGSSTGGPGKNSSDAKTRGDPF